MGTNKEETKRRVLYHLYKETGCRSGERNVALNYISQTPFEIYETTHGRNFPVGASNHFLTPTEGRIPLKKQCKGPGYTHKALVPSGPMMLRWPFSLCFKPSGYLKSLKRTQSPSSRQNSVSSPDIHHEGSPPKRRKDENDSLEKILQSIERLSNRIDSLVSRANQPESIANTDDDALSIMAGKTSGLDIGEPLATESSFKTATTPVGFHQALRC